MTSGVVSDGLNMMAYLFRTFSILRFENYPINFPIKGMSTLMSITRAERKIVRVHLNWKEQKEKTFNCLFNPLLKVVSSQWFKK